MASAAFADPQPQPGQSRVRRRNRTVRRLDELRCNWLNPEGEHEDFITDEVISYLDGVTQP